MIVTYAIIAVLLVAAELVYFKVAELFNIIDKPNERSSHSKVVLRGGGIIFTVGLWVWSAFFGLQYPWLLAAVTLAAGISFVDDVHSLPDSVRLIMQFVAMVVLTYGLVHDDSGNAPELVWYWQVWLGLVTLIVLVGATNIINFMDGINGMTAGYSLVVMVPLLLVNMEDAFVSESLIFVTILSVLVFSFFNFQPKNKARCFAGDVGSVGIAFILLFLIGCLIMRTGDITWLILLLVYGVDGCCTIIHRIMLHENLGEAHRKHAYQIMANELRIGLVKVTLLYMSMQLIVSLGYVYVCPDSILAHWIYLAGFLLVFIAAYVAFMNKYYHLHEKYLMLLSEK